MSKELFGKDINLGDCFGKMKVLIVTNHFYPENFRINDLAFEFQKRGHSITVFTGIPDYPSGHFFKGYGLFRKRVERVNNVTIKRFPLIPRGKGGALNLALNYLSSAVFSCLYILFYCREKYDVIFVFDTSPVTIGLSAVLLKKVKSIPIVFWILDLWPESLSATGSINNLFIINQIKNIVRFIYKNCDRVLVSSKGFLSNLKSIGGFSGEINYFPNWVEKEYFQKPVKEYDLPPLPEGFKVFFAGNIGAAQDFPTILAAAEKIKDQSGIKWIILGNGRLFEWVRGEIKKRGLDGCVYLLGHYPAEMMQQFFVNADVMLLTLRDDPIFSLTVPGKLQSYLASGKPVVASINGAGAQLVKDANAGLVCDAESPDELADQILEMYLMTAEERRILGENGKLYCEIHFNRNKLFDFLEETLHSTAGIDPA